MPTTLNLRKQLDRKQWSEIAPPIGGITTAATWIGESRTYDQLAYMVYGTASFGAYNPFEDAWGPMPSPGLGTWTNGACGEVSAIGPSGTATGTASNSSTLPTNLTLAMDLRGYEVLITGGPGAGSVRTIASNTIGANATITVTSPFSATITASSTYTLRTGRVYLFGGGTLAASSFRMFDVATQSFSNLSITGLPATFGTDGFLVGTPSIITRGVVTSFGTGTATGGTSTTIVDSGKGWASNQWANAYQVRITGGTGAGQTRIISSNTTTTLTLASAWTTTPDATSTYSIEGNDDYLYLIGNASIVMYRYQISTNTWTTLSPAVARANAVSAGCGSHWIPFASVPAPSGAVSGVNASDWTTENAIIAGRRLYSWRGGGSTGLDYYDIPSNSWTNGITYGPLSIAPTTGWRFAEYNGHIYIKNLANAAAVQQWYRFNPVTSQLVPWHSTPIQDLNNTLMQSAWISEYVDGSTVVPYLYYILNNSNFNMAFRSMIF